MDYFIEQDDVSSLSVALNNANKKLDLSHKNKVFPLNVFVNKTRIRHYFFYIIYHIAYTNYDSC